MSYLDLPTELWDEILSAAPAPATAQFLATNRGLRQEFLPSHQDRLHREKEQKRIDDIKTRVQEWLTWEVQVQMVKQPVTWTGTSEPRLASVELTSLLSPSFPRVTVGSQTVAVITPFMLGTWSALYMRMNHLLEGTKVRIDDNLALLTGVAPGTLAPIGTLLTLLTQNVGTTPVELTPDQLRQLDFNHHYLTVSLGILTARIFDPHIAALDPGLKYFEQLHLRSP